MHTDVCPSVMGQGAEPGTVAFNLERAATLRECPSATLSETSLVHVPSYRPKNSKSSQGVNEEQ